MRAVRVLLPGWLALALLLLVRSYAAVLDEPYDQELYSFSDTLYMQAGRYAAEDGVLATGLVPIKNNPPHADPPDAYLHMPPAFPVLLSGLIQAFGDREAVGRLTSLGLTFVMVAATVAAAWLVAGGVAGVLAGLAVVTSPAVFVFGKVLECTAAGAALAACATVPLVLAAEAGRGARRLWLAAGVTLAVLSLWMAWPALFLPVGLYAAAWHLRDPGLRRVANVCGAAMVAAFAAALVLYLAVYPELAGHLLRTVVERLNLPRDLLFPAPDANPAVALHTFVDRQPDTMTIPALARGLLAHVELFHPIAAMAVPVAFAVALRRTGDASNRRLLVILAVSAAPYLLWAIVMMQHTAQHLYVAMYAAPAVALAFGVTAAYAINWLAPLARRADAVAAIVAVGVIVPVSMVLPLAHETRVQFTASRRVLPPEAPFGRAIGRHTPDGAVVLVDSQSAVPIYYSRRHLVLGISNESTLDEALQRTQQVFPDAPRFLGLMPHRHPDMAQLRASFEVVADLPELLLLRLP